MSGFGRVLLVGKGPPDRGGIATFLSMVLAGEAAEGRDVRLLNVRHSQTRQGGRFTFANVRRTLGDAGRLWDQAGDRDIVHLHSALKASVTVVRIGILTAIGRARHCQVVVHAHSEVDTWLSTRSRALLARCCLALADRILVVSEGSREVLAAALGAQRVATLRNGVDAKAFSGSPEAPHDPPRVLFVGLLTPRKGVLDLLKASELLKQRGVAHELWLVGGPPEEGPQAEAAVRAGLVPDVRVLGECPHENMPAMYRQADVFCLPSWTEAAPLSLLEAMAIGLPTVATTVGDVPHMVDDGVTGLLVPAHDPHRLADALQGLIEDPLGRASMGAKGRRRVEQLFTTEAMIAAISAVYNDLDQRRRVSR